MSQKTENELEEYILLKEEIQKCVDRDNSLATFMVTAVASILTFAISANLQIPFLFLISFCILIPFTSRISHYKTNVSRISAYIIVFCESELDIAYESRNSRVKLKKTKLSRLLGGLRNYIGFLLGIISYTVYLVQYHNIIGISSWVDIFLCIIPIFLLIILFVMDKKIDSIPKEKQDWIAAWTNLKNQEENK